MPDPLLYLKSMTAASVVSAMVVFAVVGGRGTDNKTRLNSACVFAMCLGIAAGCYIVSSRLVWPPINGLDRFLTVVIPAIIGVEFIAGFQRVPISAAWLFRICLAAAIPRILLHDSIYLNDVISGWSQWQAVQIQATCSLLLIGVWGFLFWLSWRSGPAVSISWALALSTICAGLSVMMAGYIKGGAIAFPLAATLFATASVTYLLTKQFTPAILGIGIVTLFCVMFIGRFFGRLSTASALAMLLAPLLCWVTELPLLRKRTALQKGTIRLFLVTLVLLAVLTIAKREFDREMAPLLGNLDAKPEVSDLLREPSSIGSVSIPIVNQDTGVIEIATLLSQENRQTSWIEFVALTRKIFLSEPYARSAKRATK